MGSLQAQVDAARAEQEDQERVAGWCVGLHPPVQKSYRHFAGVVGIAQRPCDPATEEKIRGYYVKSGTKLEQDHKWASRPNLGRAVHYKNIKMHHRMLGCDA